ncbi:MAG: DNA polymerase domain-containing protein [Thermoplasmata archaeon]
MPDGWLLDITDDRDGRDVVLWVKDAASGHVRPERRPFRPPILVDGPRDLLAEVARALPSVPGVASVTPWTGRPSLFDRRRRHLLAVTARRNSDRRRVAHAVDALGDYHRLTLYDVDLSAPQLYHLGHGLYPFAPVRWVAGEPVATEPAETIDYAPPPLVLAPLEVGLAGHRRGRLPPADGAIARVRVGNAVLEGGEVGLLVEVVREIDRQDPDILFTQGGDGFDLPWLYRRARAVGLTEAEFHLGREPASFRPARAARSFATYGRVLHSDAAFPLPGRFHIDRENSFLFDDTDVEGLVDAARLSRLSLQTIVRQSPGTAFTAMEMAHALADGVHIPWKKNRAEEFRSARHLVAADRGGVIFLPPVGVFDHVEEFDFASLYPHIMVRHNLSTETLECRCCPASRRVAPELGYRSCERRVGLIPRTLAPLLARRMAYKARMAAPGCPSEEKARLQRRVKMLKWILVTAFGYQGYRNARFGRIECHEAINAYARDLIARLVRRVEASGYRVVHGIVDSLWLTRAGDAAADAPEELAAAVGREFDLPLGYEGRYRWIVFLPAVTHGLGVPNRYYGLYESGAYKLRGVGSRRHDTPGIVRGFERELLDLFAKARDADGVRRALPRVLARADLFAARLAEGSWPRGELLIAHRIAQPLDAFVTFTDTVAALRQLADGGAARSAGETVRYLVTDRSSRSWRHRVKVAEALDGDEEYDVAAYLDLLARTAETFLGPLGVRRTELLVRWHAPVEAPERDRYRAAESVGQRALGDLPGRGGSDAKERRAAALRAAEGSVVGAPF